jgi:polysaccharide deacetylase family protein (PEP-CTERM system associated)
MGLTITLDLEDSTGAHDAGGRWVVATERFLDALAERGVRATIFVVGDAARGCPALVRRAAEAGHEIGLHGLHHVALGASGPARLGDELREGRALLQDLTGQPVDGFRAPIFSLTPATAWAVDILTDVGFAYSSSVLPARNPLHGWLGLPDTPFRWTTGLLELPCPVLALGPARVPFLGGIYLRYVPARASRRALAQFGPDALAWSYVHPYDLDTGAPIRRFPHANWPTSLLLHTRRGATLRCLDRVIAAAGGAAAPLAERVRGLDGAALPQIDAVHGAAAGAAAARTAGVETAAGGATRANRSPTGGDPAGTEAQR